MTSTTSRVRSMTPTLEQLWRELRTAGIGSAQRRFDPSHPHDLYADFLPPDRPALLVICRSRPPVLRPMRSLSVEDGLRADGRWALRIVLHEPALRPVFAALCADIVAATRGDPDEAGLGAATVGRIERWRRLLEQDRAGLGKLALAGLIGELLVLETLLGDGLSPREAVAAWQGPYGAPQDFKLPSGRRIEAKTVAREARAVRINSLDQLDAGADTLALAVVRIETVEGSAADGITAPALIRRVRERLFSDRGAVAAFEAALAEAGWHEDPSHDDYAVRPITIEFHDIDNGFPLLTPAVVPVGIVAAAYTITLPGSPRTIWSADA